MDALKSWIDRYVEEFNEPFPAFELSGVPEDKKIALIRDSIVKKTPIEIEYDENKLY